MIVDRTRFVEFLFRFRVSARALVWVGILRALRPETRRGMLWLTASAAADVLLRTLTDRRAITPRSWYDGRVYAPSVDAWFRVRGGTDDLYFVLPGRETDVQASILGLLRPGDVFLDVGANVGYYSILAAKAVGGLGRVVAVEAVPETAAQLRHNAFEQNRLDNVEVVEKAVSDGTVAELRMTLPTGHYGLASTRMVRPGASTHDLTVETITLDEICARYSRIRLIKLDIEGAELAALRGATLTLEKTDALVLECEHDSEQISAFLSERGFHVSKLRFTSYLLAVRSDCGVLERPAPSAPIALSSSVNCDD